MNEEVLLALAPEEQRQLEAWLGRKFYPVRERLAGDGRPIYRLAKRQPPLNMEAITWTGDLVCALQDSLDLDNTGLARHAGLHRQTVSRLTEWGAAPVVAYPKTLSALNAFVAGLPLFKQERFASIALERTKA